MKKILILGLLKGVATLPLWMLYGISDFICLVVYHVVKYRRRVVWQNLTEAFPDKDTVELVKIEREFYRYMCDVIVETVKLLHISPKNLKRRVEVINPEVIDAATARGKSVVLLLGHYGNWEWVQEISRYLDRRAYMASIYRPLNHHPWDEVYRRIRARWDVNIIPQNRAVRALLDKDHRPWICGFIADHRPRRTDEGNIVEFLNHYTSFVYNPEVIGRKVGAEFFFLEMERVRRGYYRITFRRLDPVSGDAPYPYMRAFWAKLEEVIKRKPAYWLWSHKRWKYDKVVKPPVR